MSFPVTSELFHVFYLIMASDDVIRPRPWSCDFFPSIWRYRNFFPWFSFLYYGFVSYLEGHILREFQSIEKLKFSDKGWFYQKKGIAMSPTLASIKTRGKKLLEMKDHNKPQRDGFLFLLRSFVCFSLSLLLLILFSVESCETPRKNL